VAAAIPRAGLQATSTATIETAAFITPKAISQQPMRFYMLSREFVFGELLQAIPAHVLA